MSQDFKLRNKWLPLALALAFSGVAHAADDKPKMSYAPAGMPAVASSPAVAAPVAAQAAAKPAATQNAAQSAASSSSAEKPKTEQATEAKPERAIATTHKTVRHRIVKKSVAKKADATQKDDVVYNPQSVNEITVSDRDLNDFIFSSPISNGPILPAGVPLVGKPIYMANNTQVLLQFQKGYDKPIQVVVETEDGKVHKLYLKPRAISGVTYRVDGAKDIGNKVAAAQKAEPVEGGQPGARAEDIELLKHVVRGDIPPDFESINLPKPTRFDKFTVVPLAGWSDNGSKKIMVFSLVAVPGQTAVVAPPMFYRQGISAVMITGDHVSENSTPQLFVVEETNNE